jgi:MauM/NapG family ferredoxin protein
VSLLEPALRTRPKAAPVYLPRVVRRVYQGYFLVFFFLALALMTDEGIHRFPVRFLLQLDPMTALGTLASSFLLPAGLVIALALVALSLVFGRVFCGWICPVGTLHQIASWLTRRLRRGRFEEVNRWRPHFRLKYLVLVALFLAALSGSLLLGLLDPLSLLFRSFGSALTPALGAALGSGGARPRLMAGAWLTGALFLGLVAANRWVARWWCRALCPLGALFGLVSRGAIFRIEIDRQTCDGCRLCLRDCQGADEPFGRHRVSECHVCLNCVASCPEGAIAYRAFAPSAAPQGGVDLPRRQLLGAAVTGLAIVPLLRATTRADADPRAIRPPGALAEDEFLARCVRCGACVNACPTSALQPALGQAGLEGLYTPVLVPRRGWCEPSCVRCGEVCPTGAIRPLQPDEKGWTRDVPGVRIGTAFFDLGRCLPWAMATPCIVCEEVCPTSPKAIWLEAIEVPRRDGSRVLVKRPHLDPQRCVGCGLCEAKCPVSDQAAVRVTRAGESREPASSFTLGRSS